MFYHMTCIYKRQQIYPSVNHVIIIYCNSFFTDRSVQILDLGEVFPRQVSAYESNSIGFE